MSDLTSLMGITDVYLVVQIYPWSKFYLPIGLDIVMYDNKFETMENKIQTTDKIEPQHILKS